MPFSTKVAKVFSRAKATFTGKRTGRVVISAAAQPSGSDEPRVDQTDIAPLQTHGEYPHPTATLASSQPATTATQASISNTENEQPSAVMLPAETSSALATTASGPEAQALVADEGNGFQVSQGYVIFKSAMEVTKEFAGPFPPLKYAATGLLIVMEGFEKVQDVQNDFSYVAGKLTLMRTTYEEHRSQLDATGSTKASMESLARAMQAVEKMVQAKSNRGLFKRIWENPSDIKAVADALRMLGDVVDQFIMTVTVSTHSVVSEARQDQLLDKLAFAEKAQFRSAGNAELCTEGTRAEFLADLFAWASAPDKPRVCWVNGAAGSGKTTIASTLCSFLRGLGLLGGSFFCSRDGDAKRRSTHFIFSTLARSLAYHDPAYAHSLAGVLKEPGAGSVKATEQLVGLITAPIRSAHSAGQSSQTPIRILVIDALDECGDDDKAIYDIIHALLSDTHGLPLKFLITSRPEPHIIRAFDSLGQDSHLVRRVQDIPDEVAKTDIKTYLDSELKECARSHGIGDGWPPVSQVQELAKQADTLFIYASTACKYIRNFNEDPVKRLAALTVVRTQPLRGIDQMYEFVLDGVRRSKDPESWATTRKCLQAIVRLSHPLSLNDLGDLLDIDHREVRTALGGLQSVLRIPSSGDSNAITVFHASFPEYLMDRDRSQGKDWFIESAAVNQDLLQRCIGVMKSSLRFNISESCTSYASNDEQPFKPTLGGALRYSCLHWIDHLEGCQDLVLSALSELSELLTEKFLYWLEVLSVTGEAHRALVALTRLLNRLGADAFLTDVTDELRETNDPATKHKASSGDLFRFARDARQFVNRFGRPIAESCPHIYLSALAATTRESTVWRKISSTFVGLPKVMSQRTQDVCVIFVLRGHKGEVSSVAFSPDGTRLVSGSWDHTIRLWDAITGAAIGGPIRGYEDLVDSVAFSPDGRRIVSGFHDHTIRLWDAATGAAIGDPIRGHEELVTSVALSADGTRIVSGSGDCTIRLWDAATGAAIGHPLRGHVSYVTSVAFSADGTRVVSGSRDCTIRLWHGATGAAIGDPLREHGAFVTSVAFSPDGTRVVSGSWDKTIRLWDASTGAAIGDPIRHHDSISSVAFSPDGTRVVSGSFDHTVRLWDAATGAAIGGPFCGHESLVTSVAFSPDGTRVVSGSYDRTVRLWDAATKAAIDDPVRGHADDVKCVAFSLDGTRIVSGSDHHTIRLWEATAGAAIVLGHENSVTSATCSPDGTRVVSGSYDRTIRLWDAYTGVAIGDPLRGHEDDVTCVAFSADGTRVVSSSSDRTIRLWDANTGVAIGDPLRGHKGSVNSVAFSLDGTRIVSGSWDRTVRLWDASAGAAIGNPLRGPENDVISVAFSPDGTRIVSVSRDGTIWLWDAATRAASSDPIRGHGMSVQSDVFASDRTRFASTSLDRKIRWDIDDRIPVDDPAHIINDSDIAGVGYGDPGASSAVGPAHTSHSVLTLDHMCEVAFSPIVAHATGVHALLSRQSGRDPRDAFILDETGWLRGPDGELFLWIPAEYRRGLWWPRTTAIIGLDPVILDLSGFAHGEDWTKCFQEGEQTPMLVQ